MKIAFSTLGCPAWDFETVLNRAEAYGYNMLEIRGVGGIMNNKEIPAFTEKEADKTKEALTAHGLTISDFGASASFHDAGNLSASLAEAKDTVDVCRRFDVPYVRVFGNNLPKDKSEADGIRFVGENIRTLCDYADANGVTVLLEVHGDFNTASRILGVAEAVNRKNFGIIWDVAHSDEADKGNFLPFYQATRNLIRHVHLKDHRRGANGGLTLCPVGEGDIPLIPMVKALLADGYDGCFSLEWEKKWHPELAEPETVFPAYVKWFNEIR